MYSVFNAILLIISAILSYVLLKLFNKNSIPKGLKEIPAVKGWPLFGNLLSIREPLWRFLFKTGLKYGPIFKFSMGYREIIVLNSNKILAKALKEQGNNFAGRWQHVIAKISSRDSGIIFKDKEWWATQRSFTLKVLKDFGLGKQKSSEIINQECSYLLDDIKETCGKVVSARDLFPKSTVNVIAKLVMNMRFENEDTHFKLLVKLIGDLSHNRSFLITLITMYPVLDNFPKFAQFLLWCQGRSTKGDIIRKFITKIIDEHKQRFIAEDESEDFIDVFLKDQYKLDLENVQNHTFTDAQLHRVVLELFIAGFETTSTTLTWSMLMLAKYPAIQEKMHQEIIKIVDLNRLPSLADKTSLVYTQAVIDEIFRFSSVVPLSIPHRVFENTDIEGYFIPKNSIIFPNIYACHFDKDVWKNPFDFNPEHFLSNDNNSETKYLPRSELVPFSIGKRQCLGEALARTEFFIFLTSIIQRYKVRFENQMSEECFSKIISGTDGGIRAPLSSEIIFEMR